jgi:hypothetical protein
MSIRSIGYTSWIWSLPMFCGTCFGVDAPRPADHGADAVRPDPALVRQAEQVLDESLTFLSGTNSNAKIVYYEAGMWHFKDDARNWPGQGGPGTGAAVLWKWREGRKGTLNAEEKSRQEWLYKIAVETFDRALKDHLNPDGSFGDRQKPDTHFFALELATSFLALRDALDEATRRRWLDALTRMIDFLIGHHDLPNNDQPAGAPAWKANGWYTNGNIELGESELLYLMYKATGAEKYKFLFEQQWSHTMSPNQERWKGFGLIYIKQPTLEDGSDGAAYLAEKGAGEPGFDGDYTQFQLTIASRLYVESKDPRALRLINLLINALLPHVDQKEWVLDATNGARHSLKLPFSSCGLAVAVWCGNRADLWPLLAGQFQQAVARNYLGNARQGWGSPAFYRGYGCDLAVWLQAAALAEGDGTGR